MKSLDEIKNFIYEAGTKIGLKNDSNLYPVFSLNNTAFSDGATIYITNNEYHYVVTERGKINKHIKSCEIDDILYPLFESITFNIACKYELEHRKADKDSTRLIWKKQLELLETINPQFKDSCQADIEKILKIAPYRD